MSLKQLQLETQNLKTSLQCLKSESIKLFSDLNNSLLEVKRIVDQYDTSPVGFKAIGTFRSCFLTKNGTPRQPGLCQYARGSLTITCFNNPAHSLEQISQFSYLWILFVFHENGNLKPKAKVSPPRLNGDKVGVFASRSPHRPNNIGMSLVKLEGVVDGTLFVSGVDLIGKLTTLIILHVAPN